MIRLGVLLAGALCGCSSLEPIVLGECGNGVLEVGEDCDVHADVTLGDGVTCGQVDPGSEPNDLACRYLWDADTPCPDGWDGSGNGTCLQPSAQFEAGLPTPSWAPQSFEVLDWNGDDLIDLVGAFEQRIEFLQGDVDGRFAVGHRLSTPAVTGSVSVGQLDGNAYGDALLPTPLGFLIWRGQPQGPPLQAAFATVPIEQRNVWILPVGYAAVGPEGFLVSLYGSGNGLGCSVFNYATWKDSWSDAMFAIGVTLGQLGDRVPVTDLNGDGREEIVLAFQGRTFVRVYGLQHDLTDGQFWLAGFGSSPAPVLIEFGEPFSCASCVERESECKIDAGVHVADVNGDGDDDLLVGVACGTLSQPAVAVALGRGADGFDDAFLDDRFGLTGFPIAAGDLNGDVVADYVSSNGVFLTDTDGTLRLTEAPEEHEPWDWTHATLADVDGDGTQDIVTFAFGAPFIDVLLCGEGAWGCVESGRFARRRYDTDRGVKKLRAGSLQVLGASDIVFVEGDDSEAGDALGVLYAEPGAWPAERVYQARFPRIEQLEIAPAPILGQQSVDPLEDVQLTVRGPNDETIYAHLYADGDRQLNSPLTLPDTFSLVGDLAAGRQALAGRFFDPGPELDPGLDDLLLVGQRGDNVPRAWLLERAEEAAFAPREVGQVLLDDLGDDFELACARFATGDGDGDGRHEVIVLSGAAICPEKQTSQLAVGRELDGALAFELHQDLPLDAGPDNARLALVDLDGDGFDDLILAQAGRASVFTGGTAGLTITEAASMVDLPAEEAVLDLTKIARSVGARGPSRVAVLTSGSVVVVASQDGTSFSADVAASVDARSVRSADVNRDGLGDLILLGADGVEVLLAVAAAPLGGAL